MALHAETTVLLAGGGEAAELSVLVHGVDDPVDSGVVADSNMAGVNEDDLVVLVGGILVHPVRVKDTEVAAGTASALLGNAAKVADELELVDTVVLGLAPNNTLVVRALAATTANSHTVDDVAL